MLGGIFVSFRYYQGVGDWLTGRIPLGQGGAAFLAMVCLVGMVYLGLTRGLRFLEKLVQVTFEPKLSRVGGGLAGCLRAALVASLLLVALRQFPSTYLGASIQEHSLTGRVISRIAPAVYDSASPVLGRFWTALRGAGES